MFALRAQRAFFLLCLASWMGPIPAARFKWYCTRPCRIRQFRRSFIMTIHDAIKARAVCLCFLQSTPWSGILLDHLFGFQFKNERGAAPISPCGDTIRTTAAFIWKKFFCLLWSFFFLLSQEAAEESMSEIKRIRVVMTKCTVALCMFPSATSHQRFSEKAKW